MPGNSFGQAFRITTFGESHGAAIGVVIDGCPAGLEVNEVLIQQELDRRKPGQSKIVSQRKESDKVQVLSGIFEGITTGTPIALLINNEDARPKDYEHLEQSFRPSHGDFAWHEKFGHRDHRGGGRSSARETAARVAAGAIARIFLEKFKISISAFVSQVGEIKLETPLEKLDFSNIEKNVVRCPDLAVAAKMETYIESARKSGDTVGGIVTCVVHNCPAGLGEPVFDKLHADLGKAILSINACKGFEIGSGFSSVRMRGSEHNDIFYNENDVIKTRTNFSGGIQGGISNGMDIYFRAAFKPVATIFHDQETVNEQGETANIKGKGRHDPCVVPRAVPIVEAMTALVLADHFLRQKLSKI